MVIKKINSSRRRVLKYITYGFSLGALYMLIEWNSKGPRFLAEGRDDGYLQFDGMQVVGQEYLNNYPDERSKIILLNSIQARLKLITGRSHSASQTNLEKLIMDDFEVGDVIYLNGWALSRTECRLAALSVV